MTPPITSTATARLRLRHQQRHPSLAVQAISLSGNSLDSCRHKLVWRACELIAVSKRRKLIRRYARTRAILIIQAKAVWYRNMARQHTVGHLDTNHRRPDCSNNPRLVARFNTKACSVIWVNTHGPIGVFTGQPITINGICGVVATLTRAQGKGTLTLINCWTRLEDIEFLE